LELEFGYLTFGLIIEEINLFSTHRASEGSEGEKGDEILFRLRCDSGK